MTAKALGDRLRAMMAANGGSQKGLAMVLPVAVGAIVVTARRADEPEAKNAVK
jgi:hypothetical protein